MSPRIVLNTILLTTRSQQDTRRCTRTLAALGLISG